MNRISNKHKRNATGEWCKHPRPFLKKLGNGRLRAESLEEPIPRHKKKKVFKRFMVANLCPFCLAHIPNQWAKATYKHHGSCKSCGAVKQGKINCSKCNSTNVWLNHAKYMCKRCGTNWHKT